MDLLGHLGLTLLVIAPIVVFFKPKTATGFSVFILGTALVPDIHTYISFLIQPGSHTVPFALVAGFVCGPACWQHRCPPGD